MRKLLFLVLLLASFMVYAQDERFVRSYHKEGMLNEKGKPIGDPLERKNVFIFNYGEGKDIKLIGPGYERIFTRISDLTTEEQDGKIIYQYVLTIDEKGNKIGFGLFEDELVQIFFDSNNSIIIGKKFF